MHEFFKGWRRKVGCVLLLMACAMTTSWVRSLNALEAVWFEWGSLSFYCGHCHGRFLWTRPETDPSSKLEYWWHSEAIDHAIKRDKSTARQWRWDSDSWMMPHRFIVVPLTLLSAYLIHWKPRTEG